MEFSFSFLDLQLVTLGETWSRNAVGEIPEKGPKTVTIFRRPNKEIKDVKRTNCIAKEKKYRSSKIYAICSSTCTLHPCKQGAGERGI
jgi:hypothetical protein